MNILLLSAAAIVLMLAVRKLRALRTYEENQLNRIAGNSADHAKLASKYHCVLTDDEIRNFNLSRWD